MKQILRSLALSIFGVSAICSTGSAQTPHITSSCYTDSCHSFHSNVVTNCTFSNYTLCKVETSHGDGSKDTQTVYYYTYFTNCTPPNTYLTGYGSEAYHNYAAPGTYTIKKVLIYGSGRVDSVSGTANAACTMVGGYVYRDINSNCIYNAGTDPLLQIPLQISVDSAGVVIDTVNANGYWSYGIRGAAPTIYKFKLIGPPAGYAYACPTSGQITYTVGGSSSTQLNFGMNCSATSVFDLQLAWRRALRAASSGGSSWITLYASNSTCTATNGTVTLQVSPKYNITTSGISPTPASVSGHTIVWNIAGMAHGVSYPLHVPITPVSTTLNGDTTCNYAIITPTTGDVNVANNVISKCDTVSNSWDPNHKSVTPDGNIAAGALLTYTVQFENLGNDTAFNIHVQDTLSTYVDGASLSIISSTHAMTTNVYNGPGGSTIVKFDFPNIRLADKSHPLTNNGAFTFSVKAKAGFIAGTPITNQAGIYFDANPVVMTNTTYNKIGTPAGINALSHSAGILVYPNPVTDAITIRVQQDGWKEATLMNAMGQIVARQTLAMGENALKVHNLPAGIYYLQAKGSAGTFTQKVEKQ